MIREGNPSLTDRLADRLKDKLEGEYDFHFTPDVARHGILKAIEARKARAERKDAIGAKDTLLSGATKLMESAKDLPGTTATVDEDGVTHFSLKMRSDKDTFGINLDSKDGIPTGARMSAYEEEPTRSRASDIKVASTDEYLHDSDGSPITTDRAEAWIKVAQGYVDSELRKHDNQQAA